MPPQAGNLLRTRRNRNAHSHIGLAISILVAVEGSIKPIVPAFCGVPEAVVFVVNIRGKPYAQV
jgi:hypothetical protein